MADNVLIKEDSPPLKAEKDISLVTPMQTSNDAPASLEANLVEELNEDYHSSNEDDETSDDEGIEEEFKSRIDAILKGFEKPYDPFEEKTPRFAAYHPSCRTAARMCEDIVAEAVKLLQLSEYQDSNVRDLYDQTVRHKKINYPSAKTVGLVGNSGVGKSSLINALLDQPNLAAQAASGSACTCVVTEFVAPFADQVTPFAAEILLFELRQIKVILREYYQAHFKHIRDTGDNETASEELQKDADTAVEALQALFADHEEFRDEDNAREFLSAGTSDADPRIISTLESWMEELISRYGAQNGPIKRSADTTAEMSRILEPFVTMAESGADCGDLQAASLWPIVRLVRVGVHSPLLKRGIIIADLPGRSDVNRLRVRTTTRYVRNCYYYVLAADIARVQTDDNVQRNLQKESRAFSGRKALVCTKIDDLQSSTKPKVLQPSGAALEEFNRLVRALGVTKSESTEKEQLRRKSKGSTKASYKKQLDKLALRRKAYEALKSESLVVMRNNKVTLGMQKQHKRIASDPHILEVHCVSSNAYELHKDGFTHDFIPLSLSATGIPNLRYLLSKFPAVDKYRFLEAFVSGTLRSLIQSLEMWSKQSTVARRLEIRRAIEKPSKEAGNEIKLFLNEISVALESQVLQHFDKNKSSWISTGTQLIEQIKQMKAASVAAVCRRGGTWEPKGQGRIRISWTEKLLDPIIRDTSPAWKHFEAEVKEFTEQCYVKLSALLDGIREDLRKIEGVSVAPMEPFMASLGPKKVELHNCMEGFSDKVAKKVRDTKLDVMQGEEDGFLMKAMGPVYDKCAQIRGRGSNIARCTLLEHAISEGLPFAAMRPGVEDMMKRGLLECQEALSESVKIVFENVLKDFDRMFVVEEVPNPKRDVLREQVNVFVNGAKAKINGPIEMELATAVNESGRQ